MGDKVSKITNNSIKATNGQKSDTPPKNFKEYFFFRSKPLNDSQLEQLAEQYLHWAEHNDKALKVSQFLTANRISWEDFYLWQERSKALKQAHKWVLAILGDRREIGALERKYDASIVNRTLSYYCPVAKEQDIFKASLAKTEEDKKQNITIVVEKFPVADGSNPELENK